MLDLDGGSSIMPCPFTGLKETTTNRIVNPERIMLLMKKRGALVGLNILLS